MDLKGKMVLFYHISKTNNNIAMVITDNYQYYNNI